MRLGKLLHGDPHSTTRGSTIGPARAYEVFSAVFFAGRRRRVFARLVELSGASSGDRVLEVGCGPGYLTRLAADVVGPDGTALGIDPSPTVIGYAQRKTRQPHCRFQLGVAEALELPDESVDVVLSSLMVHHLPEDLRPRAFAEMLRVLRPGGRLLVADFRPPRGRVGRHLVGAVTDPAMQHNPIHLPSRSSATPASPCTTAATCTPSCTTWPPPDDSRPSGPARGAWLLALVGLTLHPVLGTLVGLGLLAGGLVLHAIAAVLGHRWLCRRGDRPPATT